jgi:hypothetical protein
LLLLSWEVKRERDRKCPCPPAPSLSHENMTLGE